MLSPLNVTIYPSHSVLFKSYWTKISGPPTQAKDTLSFNVRKTCQLTSRWAADSGSCQWRGQWFGLLCLPSMRLFPPLSSDGIVCLFAYTLQTSPLPSLQPASLTSLYTFIHHTSPDILSSVHAQTLLSLNCTPLYLSPCWFLPNTLFS